jgi:hypothetical protein
MSHRPRRGTWRERQRERERDTERDREREGEKLKISAPKERKTY